MRERVRADWSLIRTKKDKMTCWKGTFENIEFGSDYLFTYIHELFVAPEWMWTM